MDPADPTGSADSNLGIKIIYETDEILVVEKPAPLLVYRSKPNQTDSLLDRLNDLFAYDIANGKKLSVITRLDRETSGVCLFAKTENSARELGIAMQEHQFKKTYQLICWGWPEEDNFTINQSIRREGEITENIRVYIKQCAHPNGAEACTTFTILKRFNKKTSNGEKFSIVQAKPVTGRTHQIRVHMASIGHPIVGDKLYGNPGENAYLDFINQGWSKELHQQLLLRRQALHATELTWPEKELQWESSWPVDLLV